MGTNLVLPSIGILKRLDGLYSKVEIMWMGVCSSIRALRKEDKCWA
jgi:hypothetical protein